MARDGEFRAGKASRKARPGQSRLVDRDVAGMTGDDLVSRAGSDGKVGNEQSLVAVGLGLDSREAWRALSRREGWMGGE